jgi:hypothetical protein
MSDMTLRATIRRDSAALAEVSMRPAAVRSLLRWERAEPRLFPSALGSERLVCVSVAGKTTNVNIFFRYPEGGRKRTDQYKEEEHLALAWVRTDRWRLMTWTLWSRL